MKRMGILRMVTYDLCECGVCAPRPNNARSKSSGIWLSGRKTVLSTLGLAAVVAVAFVTKPEESKAVVKNVVSKLRR